MDAAPPSLPPDVDRRRSFLILFGTCHAFEVLFVLARMYVRTFVRKALGWDDYLICFALALRIINEGFAITSLHYGLMRHIYYLSPEEIAGAIKWMKGMESVSVIVPVLIKLSVSISILRLINMTHRTATVILWVMNIVLILASLLAFLVQMMQCIPLDKLWEPQKPGRCISTMVWIWIYVAYGIICTITDFICGIVPTLVLHKLQMDKLTKVALCCLLGLVLIPGIFSIIKTIEAFSLDNPDITWTVSGISIWVDLEIAAGFIIACLPMLWLPTLTAVKAVRSRLSSWHSVHRSSKNLQSGQQRLDSTELKSPVYPLAAVTPATGNRNKDQWPSSPNSPYRADSDEYLAPLRDARGTIRHTQYDVFDSHEAGERDLEAFGGKKKSRAA